MKVPNIVKNDRYLEPFASIISQRLKKAQEKEHEILQGSSLNDFAQGHKWYGLHWVNNKWIIHDWAPNATAIFLIGEFNNWEESPEYALKPTGYGNWEIKLMADKLKHGDLYAFSIYWNGGQGKRIPAWANRVVQDEYTKIFNAQVWAPDHEYPWNHPHFIDSGEAPLIYEAHIGMAGQEQKVHTYNEFRVNILPRIQSAGYNTIQLMAIPEHPYYGSFGYHVSSFFAPSSRFGTPEELKELVDSAHGMGISVIIDLVHSHAVKNEVEGLGRYDGTRWQFFHDGGKGEHPAWDSYCFNYGKPEVIHFLLSNIRYWLEEFKFDGFRFDGVTSMLYFDHGLGKAFTCYDDYFNAVLDQDAFSYFIMANRLIHQINPKAISIAEEVSGLPGLATPHSDGGVGFNYRMAMGVPDFWIRLIKETPDEHWDVGSIFHELTSKRLDEKVVSYSESHDQALVGDKTIIFRLIDKEMYYSMRKDQHNLAVERGIALQKMIRLATISCAGGAYLNFMGNEFGHPEWIDFPREGNNWSYAHARRLWSLADNHDLQYEWLLGFDRSMIELVKKAHLIEVPVVKWIFDNKKDQILVFSRGKYLFVFNFNPVQSFVDYGIPVESGKYKIILDTDDEQFGGQHRVDRKMTYCAIPKGSALDLHFLNLYLPVRTAQVFEKQSGKKITT
jgi:1,4-alpha-glucan branching enzyme